MTRLALVLGLNMLFAACAIDMPAVPMRQFEAGEIQAVATAMEEELQDGAAENAALVHNILGECDLMLGDKDAAWRNFATAGRIMGNWSTSGGEAFSAIVGSESSKTYKGDPYEKSMNAFYLALCFLWRGEPDNARAALKRGILADAEVGDERFRADNPLLFWMAGRMSLLMGMPSDAEGFFNEATKANEWATKHGSRGDVKSAVVGAPSRGNLVVFVECGMGPEKFAAGGMEELARFRPRFSRARGARVLLDGKAVGESVVMCDVDYQARTLGGTEMEGIRKGKAVFKSTALIAGDVLLDSALIGEDDDKARTRGIVGGALIVAGLLTSTAADTRHWATLPSTVQVLCIDADPGPHDLTLEFLDAKGRALADLRQEWSVDVAPDSESYYLFRSLPGLDRLLTQ